MRQARISTAKMPVFFATPSESEVADDGDSLALSLALRIGYKGGVEGVWQDGASIAELVDGGKIRGALAVALSGKQWALYLMPDRYGVKIGA